MECGKLNDSAIRKEAEVTKLEQRLVKEIEFEKQQADGMPEDFASAIAMAHPSQKLNGAERGAEDVANNAAVFALKASELSSSARGKASSSAARLSPNRSRCSSNSVAASFRPLSPPQWGEAPGASSASSIAAANAANTNADAAGGGDYVGWDNAAAKHYLRDAPLMDYLARQTEELQMALEVEQAGALTLAHVASYGSNSLIHSHINHSHNPPPPSLDVFTREHRYRRRLSSPHRCA